MTALPTPWEQLARLTEDGHAILMSDGSWSPPVDREGALVFGRGPEPTGQPPARLLAMSLRRELTLLRLRSSGRVRRLVRIPPPMLRLGSPRERVMAALRAGAVVVLGRDDKLDEVADAAGVSAPSEWTVGSGGSLLCRGTHTLHGDAILRLGVAGGSSDPRGQVDALTALRDLPVVPLAYGSGTSGVVAWLVEQALPGRRPSQLTDGLLRELADVMASLPVTYAPPTAHRDDLEHVASRLPERGRALRELRADIDHLFADLPSMARHGDLWLGNVLVEGGHVAGLVDWDAFHPNGAPGADLLQLVATDWRHAGPGRSLGDAWQQRFDRIPPYRALAERVWQRLGQTVGDDQHMAVALCWWAAEVAGTLRRVPIRAADTRWVHDNVDQVLAAV